MPQSGAAAGQTEAEDSQRSSSNAAYILSHSSGCCVGDTKDCVFVFDLYVVAPSSGF